MKLRKCSEVIGIVFILFLGTILIFASVLFMFGASDYILKKQNVVNHASKYDANWGLRISDSCSEIYYVESDHGLRGEGWRYHVFSDKSESTIGLPTSENGDVIQISSGDSACAEIKQFLSKIYQKIEVPNEYQYSCDHGCWRLYQQQDGSRLLVLKDTCGYLFIVEELL